MLSIKKMQNYYFELKKKLGFGSVYPTSEADIWRYSVTGQANCLRLYYLFNGNLFLEKTRERFNQWSMRLNPKTGLKQRPLLLTLTSGWLSGFIDAEGGFYARIRKNIRTKTGFQFQKKFYITQKSERTILEQILKLLESNAQIYSFQQYQQNYYIFDFVESIA